MGYFVSIYTVIQITLWSYLNLRCCPLIISIFLCRPCEACQPKGNVHCLYSMLLVSRWNTRFIVCQMLSWRTKNWSHFINIWDTVTNVIPLCSVHQAPSYEHNLILLAWILQDLAYLSMLFILEVLCTACSAEHLKNK